VLSERRLSVFQVLEEFGSGRDLALDVLIRLSVRLKIFMAFGSIPANHRYVGKVALDRPGKRSSAGVGRDSTFEADIGFRIFRSSGVGH
jgi:hypothetical protein